MNRQAIGQLLDIVGGMVADGDLHDLEIEFLKVWLAEHTDVARVWPGSAISRAIEAVLADGHVSEDERAYLMATLAQLAAPGADGEASAGAVPFDETTPIALRDALVCLGGEFLRGTRSTCERLLETAGAWPAAAVSKNVQYLVVGARASAASTSDAAQFVRDALALQQSGHPIAIVSERRWLASLEAGHASR